MTRVDIMSEKISVLRISNKMMHMRHKKTTTIINSQNSSRVIILIPARTIYPAHNSNLVCSQNRMDLAKYLQVWKIIKSLKTQMRGGEF